MMYNYHDGMNSAGIHLSSNKRSFVKTFAPKAEDDSRVAESILSVNQIPLGIALSRFIGGCKCHGFSTQVPSITD